MKGGKVGGPVLSRTGSVERSFEDQLLKDLQDSIERENDLKEQLGMSEEESKDMRMRLSRFEDENESLVQQLKKMSNSGSGNKRISSSSSSSSLRRNDNDLQLQLEVSAQETSVLRKKVESLMSENIRLTKDIKDLNATVNEERRKKSSGSSWRSNSASSSQLDEVQTELNSTWTKLLEREREVERLESQLKSSRSSSRGGRGGGSEDLQSKIDVIEKEATVLRDRNAQLEAENERIQGENRQKYGRKPPASTHEKLQMDKFVAEEKVRNLDAKIKELNRKVDEAQNAATSSKQDSIDVGRLRREKSNLERDLKQSKDAHSNDSARLKRLERDLALQTEKIEKSEREVITAQREKRAIEEEKNSMQRNLTKAELTSQRLQDECDGIRRKNSSNLQQTQEGIRQFSDQ